MFNRRVFQWLTGLGLFYLVILILSKETLKQKIQLISTLRESAKVSPLDALQIECYPISGCCCNCRISTRLGVSPFPILFQLLGDPRSLLQEARKNIKHTGGSEDSSEVTLKQVIDLQRELISREMEGYQYPNGKYNISASKLEDLLIEENGRPVRTIVVTTWRSGSTFCGDILNAHPGNFYHYEPLADFGIVKIRGLPLAAKAIERAKALLNCNYTNLDGYIEYGKANPWTFDHNTRLWKRCKTHEELCYTTKFLSEMCQLYPFQLMKFTRLRLSVAQELLADKKLVEDLITTEHPLRLAIRMLLLVRDPRGTMQSRKHVDFCRRGRDCSDPASLCADLASDYKVAVKLRKKHPNTFRVIRYEDLATDPYKQAEELHNFFGRDFHQNVKEFIDTHTTIDMGGPYQTTRNSKMTPYHWTTDLDFKEVEELQRVCAVAMEYLGYVPAMNATHQMEFHPVTHYDLSLSGTARKSVE